jgi:gamma-tubulin complex component 2
MHTCTLFATYSTWLSRELERIDEELSGNEKPRSMNKDQWERFKVERDERNERNRRHGDLPSATSSFDRMDENMKKYEENFSKHLRILLDALNHYAATETVVLLGLCARLSTANQGTQYSGLRTDEDAGVRA